MIKQAIQGAVVILSVYAVACGGGDEPPNASGNGAGGNGAGGGNGGNGGSGGAPGSSIIPDDRRVDWHPGLPGGIPNLTTICARVTDPPYNAVGDGVADDSGPIQAALDACPPGQVVLAPAGTYRLLTGLSIPSGVVLRGEGLGVTRIEGDQTAEKSIIQAGSWDEANSPVTQVTGSFDRGSTVVQVASTVEFVPGDFVIIDQLNDDDLVRVSGQDVDPSESGCIWGSRDNGTRLLAQMVEIKSIDSAANTVTIDPPLAMPYSANLAPEMIRVRQQITRDVGIEDLTVADRSYRGDNNANIRFWGVAYSWIRNVESAFVSGRHIQLTKAFRCEIRDSYVHEAHVYNPGANAYGIAAEIQTSETLIENNVVYHLNAGLMLDSAGPGNVIGYNFSDEMYGNNYPDANWIYADLVANHCAHPFMSLYEGNQGTQISSDNIHGSSSHQTFFRNHVDRQHDVITHTGNLASVVFAANNRYMNVVGNILGQPGDDAIAGAVYEQTSGNCLDTVAVFKFGYPSNCGVGTVSDPQVGATVLRHGNFDYVGGAVVWDPAIKEQTLPASLYLSAKPSWWGSVAWPAIGPDVSGYVNEIPAKTRYHLLTGK